MGREVGGGIGMGKTCEPKAFSFQCMAKFTTKKKKNDEREEPTTKNTFSVRVVYQILERNQELFKQAKDKRILNHKTIFRAKAKTH